VSFATTFRTARRFLEQTFKKAIEPLLDRPGEKKFAADCRTLQPARASERGGRSRCRRRHSRHHFGTCADFPGSPRSRDSRAKIRCGCLVNSCLPTNSLSTIRSSRFLCTCSPCRFTTAAKSWGLSLSFTTRVTLTSKSPARFATPFSMNRATDRLPACPGAKAASRLTLKRRRQIDRQAVCRPSKLRAVFHPHESAQTSAWN